MKQGQKLISGYGDFESGFMSAWEHNFAQTSTPIDPQKNYTVVNIGETVDYGTAQKALMALEAAGVAARIVDGGYVATNEMNRVLVAVPQGRKLSRDDLHEIALHGVKMN